MFLLVSLRDLPLVVQETSATRQQSAFISSLPVLRESSAAFKNRGGLAGFSGRVAVNNPCPPRDKKRVRDQPNNQPLNYSHMAPPPLSCLDTTSCSDSSPRVQCKSSRREREPMELRASTKRNCPRGGTRIARCRLFNGHYCHQLGGTSALPGFQADSRTADIRLRFSIIRRDIGR